MIDLNAIKNRGLNKRYWMGLCLLILGFLLFFNLNHLMSKQDDWSLSNMFDDSKEQQHKYLVVIGTEAQYESRRKVIRSSYFDITDNLVPVEFDTVQYAFLVHEGPPNSNTPERRSLEAEKMEYNDIYQLPKDTPYNRQTIIDWLKSNDKKFSFEYLIIQDIHSFMNLNQIIKEIEKSDQVIQWVDNDTEMIVHRSQLDNLKADNYPQWQSQVWQNSVESTNKQNILVKQVYQDEDFKDLATLYQLQPIISMKTKQAKRIAIVTSSYIYDKCMEPSGTKAALNKRNYADKHGYAFVARSREFAQQALRPDQRRTVWGKIDVIQKVLPKYDWIFWLDMDAVFLNDQFSIETLFKELETKHDLNDETNFIIVRPGTDKMINAGVFLIKNTPWSFKFLQDIQAREEWYRQGPSYEQGAMWDVMRQEEYAAKTLFLDRENHIFNTFPQLYEDGDFIVHFAPDKCPNAATLKGLAAADKLKQGQKINKADLL